MFSRVTFRYLTLQLQSIDLYQDLIYALYRLKNCGLESTILGVLAQSNVIQVVARGVWMINHVKLHAEQRALKTTAGYAMMESEPVEQTTIRSSVSRVEMTVCWQPRKLVIEKLDLFELMN